MTFIFSKFRTFILYKLEESEISLENTPNSLRIEFIICAEAKVEKLGLLL